MQQNGDRSSRDLLKIDLFRGRDRYDMWSSKVRDSLTPEYSESRSNGGAKMTRRRAFETIQMKHMLLE